MQITKNNATRLHTIFSVSVLKYRNKLQKVHFN